MSERKPRQSAIEYAQREQQQRDDWTRADRIEDLIERCSRAIGRGEREHYRFVAVKLRDELIPLIRRHSGKSFADYDRKLARHDGWDWVALTAFLDAPDAYVSRLSKSSSRGLRDLGLQINGLADEDTAAMLVVRKTLSSITAIAEDLRIVLEDYASRVDVVGFSIKLGEHLQKEDMDFGDPVVGVTDQVGYLKTLHAGGTGTGKSTGAEREFEDFYRRNFEEGRDVKCIDLVDFGEGENWLYDVPQQQSSLRRARSDMDLPETFEGVEGYDLDVEILVPLTPRISQKKLPFDVEADRFSVRPFTIAASDLSKPLLVALIGSRLSSTQDQTIRDVYEAVDERSSDWSLRDLVDEILTRDELSDKHKRAAIGVIRSLQSEGFIRTREDPRTLDWSEIFRSTETITVFSQALCESEVSQIATVAYLIDEIWRRRRETLNFPDLALLVRELWEIIPHDRRQLDDDRAASIQRAIGSRFTRLVRKNRHIKAHVTADTQEPRDLTAGVRSLFNRYVVFEADRDTVKMIFSATSNSNYKSFQRTITSKTGQAGIVGQVEPARTRPGIEFISPVEYAPPSFHHLDTKIEQSGWHARARYLDREELRRTGWDDEIPDELRIPSTAELSGDDDEDVDEGYDRKEVVREIARNRFLTGESYRAIADHIPNNPKTGKPYAPSTIGDWVADLKEDDGDDPDQLTESGA